MQGELGKQVSIAMRTGEGGLGSAEGIVRAGEAGGGGGGAGEGNCGIG